MSTFCLRLCRGMPHLVTTQAAPGARMPGLLHGRAQVNVAPGSWLRADGREWQLLQWHFHAPSEHARGGARQAMEAHLVHRDAEGAAPGVQG